MLKSHRYINRGHDKDYCTAGQTRSKWPKMQTSASKFLASIFGDVQGIFFINYLEKGRTINSEYYIALMVHLKEEITKKWPQIKKKKSALSPRQCTVSQVDHNNGKTTWITLRTASGPTLLSRLVGWFLWHINLCRLFNAKFCLHVYINQRFLSEYLEGKIFYLHLIYQF